MHAPPPFHALHQQATALVLPNAWDAASARLLDAAGAPAVATSSASLSWSLGYPDGGALPRHELLGAVARILRCIAVPLSVDIEDGFSADPAAVADLASTLAGMGVAGINLEDGGGEPSLLAEKIRAIRASETCRTLSINARTDVCLRQLASGEAAVDLVVRRGRAYRDAGADGLFVPGLSLAAEVAGIAGAVGIPLNLMWLPGLPDRTALETAGMRRLSAGPAPFLVAYAQFERSVAAWTEGAADALRVDGLSFARMDALVRAGQGLPLGTTAPP
ncbi:MAG: isocitrate lyase/phosphoenolpyruvate mutase family protein [Xanthomonadales bacterium]|nr:isocitrate lyase/phosphoenolpyruvate mutase family protein [Xanthomonadales bacterium]